MQYSHVEISLRQADTKHTVRRTRCQTSNDWLRVGAHLLAAVQLPIYAPPTIPANYAFC